MAEQAAAQAPLEATGMNSKKVYKQIIDHETGDPYWIDPETGDYLTSGELNKIEGGFTQARGNQSAIGKTGNTRTPGGQVNGIYKAKDAPIILGDQPSLGDLEKTRPTATPTAPPPPSPTAPPTPTKVGMGGGISPLIQMLQQAGMQQPGGAPPPPMPQQMASAGGPQIGPGHPLFQPEEEEADPNAGVAQLIQALMQMRQGQGRGMA